MSEIHVRLHRGVFRVALLPVSIDEARIPLKLDALMDSASRAACRCPARGRSAQPWREGDEAGTQHVPWNCKEGTGSCR
jgi:hypothetical protein